MLSVREWAIREKVNPNTMQKALSELEEMGLIRTERTNGKFVTSDPELIARWREQEAARIAREYCFKMGQIGLNIEEALYFLEKLKGENDLCS